MHEKDTLFLVSLIGENAYKNLTNEQAVQICENIRNEACQMAAFRIRSEIERSLISLSKRFPNYHFAFNGKTIESCETPF